MVQEKEQQIFIVKSQEEGMRLDSFLFERLCLEEPGIYSRGIVAQMINQGCVLQNEKAVLKPAKRVRMNDRITYKQMDGLSSGHTKLEGEVYPEPVCLFEDEYIVCVNKPAGIMTHPVRPGDVSLVNWLSVQYPRIMQVGDNPLRPGIVHRLDKDTSGVMVIAKTAASFEALKVLFQQRLVQKTYYALTTGHLRQTSGDITFPITRIPHSEKRSIRRAVNNPHAKEAITQYRVLQRLRESDFVEVRPKTGRTHQIRVHLSAVQHPIIGDRLYGFRSTTSFPVNRHMLHAGRLCFVLGGKKYDIEAPLPIDFARALQDLTEKE